MTDLPPVARRQVVLPVETYVDGVTRGDRAMLARAITLIESTNPEHEAIAQQVLLALLPRTGHSVRIGISGVPGAGKSTFIETFGRMVLDKGHRVAVLAVDPTSPRTGGSVLGDKTRMTYLSQDVRAFIRPSPTAGTLGGVARRTREAMLLCEAAGFDVVIIETVGVGQSEATVSRMVDFFLVLLLASGGDELQGIKRGILELADLVAVNKCDVESPAVVNRAMADFGHAMRILRGADAGDAPRVVRCSGLTGEGLDAIWNRISPLLTAAAQGGALAERRARQNVEWLWTTAESALLSALHDSPEVQRIRAELEADVRAGRTTPTLAARRMLEAYVSGRI